MTYIDSFTNTSNDILSINNYSFGDDESNFPFPSNNINPIKPDTSPSDLDNDIITYIDPIDKNKSKKKSKKIFECKEKKRRGPRPNKKKIRPRNHDKKSRDNIHNKIIQYFSVFIVKRFNARKKCSPNLKKLKPILKKYSTQDLLYNYMINTTIGEMLSQEISSKYKKGKKDDDNYYINYNKKIIKNIYDNKETNKELIEILNLKIDDMFRIFIGENKEKKYNDFYGLDLFVGEKCDNKDDEYKTKLTNTTKEFLETIKNSFYKKL